MEKKAKEKMEKGRMQEKKEKGKEEKEKAKKVKGRRQKSKRRRGEGEEMKEEKGRGRITKLLTLHTHSCFSTSLRDCSSSSSYITVG